MREDRIARLLADIRSYCANHGDPREVARYARYFREGFDAYGIHHEDPGWQEQKKQWLLANQDLGLSGFLDLGDRLLESGKLEEGNLAVYFAAQFREQFRRATFQRLGRWLDGGVRNWAHCDYLCGELLSGFLKEGITRLDDMARWRAAAAKYKRRAVPVAMLGLLKTERDYAPLLDFLRPLMHDPERVVHQGLGWFLREAWKRQPRPVERFLKEFKDTSPRLIFQYATEKMTPEARARFRRRRPLRSA
jgi:3-methyladenine DNA glycosylase AlkD